jgi:hypothetical protein
MFNWFKTKPKELSTQEKLEQGHLWTNPEVWFVAVYGDSVSPVSEVKVYGITNERFPETTEFFCQLPNESLPRWHENGWCNKQFFKTKQEASVWLLSKAQEHKRSSQHILARSTRLERIYAAL